MTVWVVLLRGVGGRTQLDARLLRATLKAEGFDQVKVTGHSGNAVLLSPLPAEEVAARVASACEREMGFRKGLQVIAGSDLVALAASNPFPMAMENPSTLHLGFLGAEPDPDRVEAIRRLGDGVDKIVLKGRVTFLHVPRGWERSRLADRFDRGIGVPATTRSWSTVLQILPLVEAALAVEAG